MSEIDFLERPFRTPKGMLLSSDDLDPYETFSAYFYAMEATDARRDFDAELFVDISLDVYTMLEPFQVPPRLTLQLIANHPAFNPSHLPAWLRATSMVCIEKAIAANRSASTLGFRRAKQSALWMMEANTFSGMAGMAANGSTDAFIAKAVSVRQSLFAKKPRPGDQKKKKEAAKLKSMALTTARDVTVAAMREFRNNNRSLPEFLATALAGGFFDLDISEANGRYEIDSERIIGNELPSVSLRTFDGWWKAASSEKQSR